MEQVHVVFSFVRIDDDLVRRVAAHLSADETRIREYLAGDVPDTEVERAFAFFGVYVSRGEQRLPQKHSNLSMGCAITALPPPDCPHSKQ